MSFATSFTTKFAMKLTLAARYFISAFLMLAMWSTNSFAVGHGAGGTTSGANSAIKTAEVVYKSGEQSFTGLVSKPANLKGAVPGLLLIHNWMGVTAETKLQAERYAKLGYVVFSVDVYGTEVRPKDAKEAGFEATKYKSNRKLFRERLELGLEQLKKDKSVDAHHVAVLGYCFGGTGALELARDGAEVAGAISFHGGLDSPVPDDGKKIKTKIIAFHGAIDPYVAAADLSAFENEMITHKVDYQLVKFGGAVHSFTERAAGTDISKGAAYNEKADLRSFQMAEQFLREIFIAKK